MERLSPETTARLRADVEALAAFPRDSAGPGERRSARWIADRLDELGAAEVRVESHRGAPTYAWSHLAHALAGLSGRRWAALAALVSLELEVSGRRPWVRRLLPRGEGANVTARLPTPGARRMTLVLVAHHDAARTGLIWRRALVAAGAKARLRRHAMDPRALPFAAGLVLVGLGARRLGRVLLGAVALAELDIATQKTVPGADDNATGVAGVLALAERLRDDPIDGVEVLLAFPGGEEAGMDGMRAFLDKHDHDLDPATTFVLGLDTLGSGTPIVLTAEATLLPHRYRPQDLARVPSDVERWRGGAWTDPILATYRGLPTVSILSVDAAGVHAHWHVADDTPDNVDFACVERCVAAAEATARTFTL